jgi:hypothetical protein
MLKYSEYAAFLFYSGKYNPIKFVRQIDFLSVGIYSFGVLSIGKKGFLKYSSFIS